MLKLKNICFLLVFTSSVFGKTREEEFIHCLIFAPDSAVNFVDSGEFTRSHRLGITYMGVNDKWLIGFDIDEQIMSDIKSGKLNYKVNVLKLEDEFSRADFIVQAVNYSKSFYFKAGSFIPNSSYITRNWKEQQSKYFIFRISEPKYFNDYCIRKLDEFVDKIADTLGFTNKERSLLEREKIYYTFCKDENEIEQLTGYKSKGQAILAYDEVITAFQTHYHEIVHLLVNYKLKNLGLYTLPFFMEGFAVALGGRGGMAPRVVTDLGYYLQKTGFLTYDSILTYEAFMNQDANMTYAVSGLYNSFLVNEFGMKKYMELYKIVNGDIEFVKNIKSNQFYISSVLMFENFLDMYEENKSINLVNQGLLPSPCPPNFDCVSIYRMKKTDDNFYYFNTNNKLFCITLSQKNQFTGYISKLYEESEKSEYYVCQQYLVIVDTSKLKLYNCLNNELEASYDINFSLYHKPVPVFKEMFRSSSMDYYVFSFAVNLFDSKLSESEWK